MQCSQLPRWHCRRTNLPTCIPVSLTERYRAFTTGARGTTHTECNSQFPWELRCTISIPTRLCAAAVWLRWLPSSPKTPEATPLPVSCTFFAVCSPQVEARCAMELPVMQLDTSRPWASRIDRRSAARRAGGNDGAAGDAARRDAAMGVAGSTAAPLRGEQAAATELPVLWCEAGRRRRWSCR